MSEKRIIPCLDIKDGRVVKGVHFVDLADIGDPAEIARRYNEQSADEIVFLDITATTESRDTHYDLFRRAAEGLTIPLAVGGGIRSVEDFQKLFDAGVSKGSINSAAVANPALIAEASAKFGKAAVVVAIDAKKVGNRFEVVVNGGQTNTGLDLVEWAKQCETLGAGEILLTSMDKDGTKDGYDIEMTRAVVEAVNIPVTASGGCGSVDDIVAVFKETDCAAALAASLFHYGTATVEDVKRELERNGIPCRR
ncbi:MAG: imidazole glycerol phosphate synthase subunit HisF [Oscillospiraceae bacterium]|nr:imidazole glycerol phosphate synthase subunit HisF [Oscillospiraceae bacterium]